MKIILDKYLCSNTGNCYQFEGSCLEQSEVKSAKDQLVKTIDQQTLEQIKELVNLCPNSAISIDDEGLYEFPDVGP